MNKTRKRMNETAPVMLEINGLCDALSLGRRSAEKIGEDAKAVVRVGRRKLYNFQKIQKYVDAISE